MMSYYLLRNNQESGPYTLRELKSMQLLSTDLIWINGESTCWSNPDEIEELKGLAKDPKEVKSATVKNRETPERDKTTTSFSTFSTAAHSEALSVDPRDDFFEEKTPVRPSFEELKKKYEQKAARKKVWQPQISVAANLFGIVILLIGVSAAAFMIKKAVENIEYEPIVATAEATEIGIETLPVSTTSQDALAPKSASFMEPEQTLAETGQEQHEPVIVVEQQTTVNTRPNPAVVNAEKEAILIPEVEENSKAEQNVATTDPDAEENKSVATPEAEEKKNAKPNLQLSASNYKVGMLGGISNLELSVSNPTSHPVSKAIVEVEYLKPNGKVINSQTFEVSGIAPGSSKKITVPDNSRGVSVRYRVVNIEV